MNRALMVGTDDEGSGGAEAVGRCTDKLWLLLLVSCGCGGGGLPITAMEVLKGPRIAAQLGGAGVP